MDEKLITNLMVSSKMCNVLDNIISNPCITCKYMDKKDIQEEKWLLDKGAIELLKSYYKSKLIVEGNSNGH